MRHLGNLLFLLVTVVVSYRVPELFFLAFVAYFPGFPEELHMPGFVAFALGIAFLGGTIVARAVAWRHRVVVLALLLWLGTTLAVARSAAAFGSQASFPDAFFDALTEDAGLLLLATGMSMGLFVGVRYMKPVEPTEKVSDKSGRRTHVE